MTGLWYKSTSLYNIHFLYYYIIIYVGPFNLTANDVDGTWDMVGHVVNDTWIIEHVRVLPSVRKLKLYFDLFQDNKEISEY